MLVLRPVSPKSSRRVAHLPWGPLISSHCSDVQCPNFKLIRESGPLELQASKASTPEMSLSLNSGSASLAEPSLFRLAGLVIGSQDHLGPGTIVLRSITPSIPSPTDSYPHSTPISP